MSERHTTLIGLAAAFLVWLSLITAMGVHADPGNRDNAIALVLVHEGGARYTNHPADPGGPTKYGITIHDVRRYLNPRATAEDVKRLTEAQAIEIYRLHYWNAIAGDRLPRGLDYAVVDYSVNAGPGRAGKDLRRALGLPTVTWKVDDDVLAAIRSRPVRGIIEAFQALRMRFQMGLSSRYDVFKRGWRSRINSVTRGALSQAGVIDKAGPGNDLIPRSGPGKTPGFDDESEDDDVRI